MPSRKIFRGKNFQKGNVNYFEAVIRKISTLGCLKNKVDTVFSRDEFRISQNDKTLQPDSHKLRQ